MGRFSCTMRRCAATNGAPTSRPCGRASANTVRCGPACIPGRTPDEHRTPSAGGRHMSLVFAGVCSHAPGITGRSERADPAVRDAFYAGFDRMRLALEAQRPDALIVVAAEHFANFFMNNMPSICIGMGEHYEGPIEDEAWIRIKRTRVPGNSQLSKRLIETVMQDVDVA